MFAYGIRRLMRRSHLHSSAIGAMRHRPLAICTRIYDSMSLASWPCSRIARAISFLQLFSLAVRARQLLMSSIELADAGVLTSNIATINALT